MQIRIEAGLQEGARPPPPVEGGMEGGRAPWWAAQPLAWPAAGRCGQCWAMLAGRLGDPIHPVVNQPLEMCGEVCTMSAQTLPGSPPGLGNFHSHEFTNSTYKRLIKTIREAVWRSPPRPSLSAAALWNHRKSLAVPTKNFWIPKNYSHFMYSELFRLYKVICGFHRFVCDAELCSS